MRVIIASKDFHKTDAVAQTLDFVGDFVLVQRCIFSHRARVTGKFSSIFVGEAKCEAILCPTRSTLRWRSSSGCEWLTLDRGFARFAA